MVVLDVGERAAKVVHVATVDRFEEVGELVRRYGVSRCVIDGLPNQHSARELARDLPGTVSLCYYAEGRRAEAGSGPSRDSLSVDRTEALDRMVCGVKRGEIALPSRLGPEVEELMRHLVALAKVQREDDQTGRPSVRYIRTGPDHYAHALTYALLARDTLGRVPVVTARAGRQRRG